MANRPDSNRTLSTKTKLVLILIMFVVINLIFYFGFDSSDESGNPFELGEQDQLMVDKTVELEEDMNISLLP